MSEKKEMTGQQIAILLLILSYLILALAFVGSCVVVNVATGTSEAKGMDLDKADSREQSGVKVVSPPGQKSDTIK